MNNNEPEVARENKKKNRVFLSVLALASGTLLSRLFGLVRDALLGSLFPRAVSDAFVVAFRLPNMVRQVLGDGSLSVCFIPVYLNTLKESDDRFARHLADQVYTIITVITLIASTLGVVFMPQLISWMVNNAAFSTTPQKMSSAIAMGRIMFSFLYLVTIYSYFVAIGQAHQKFLVGSVAPVFFNLFVILGTLIPDSKSSGIWVSWSVIAGGMAQLIVVSVSLYRMGRLPKLTLRVWGPRVKKIIELMIPAFCNLGVMQLISLVSLYFASSLPEGTLSHVYWMERILELPMALLALSLGAAVLPHFASQFASGSRENIGCEIERFLRALAFFALPATLGLHAFATPLVRLIFQRGEFGPQDTAAVATLVEFMSYTILASSVARVLLSAYYSVQNTWIPALITITSLFSSIVMLSWGVAVAEVEGFAIARLGASFFTTTLYVVLFTRFVAPVKWLRLLVNCLPYVLVSAATVVLGANLHRFLVSITNGASFFFEFLSLAIALGFCLIFYAGINLAIGSPEAVILFHKTRGRVFPHLR